MKIVYVSDFNVLQYLGGAELTDHYWILKGIELGLNIVHTTHNQPFVEGDYYIVSNHSRYTDDKLDIIKRSGNYTVIVHGAPYGDLITKARRVIGMSPSHAQRLKKYNERVTYSAPYIPDFYKDYGQDREDKGLYIGNILAHKGIERTIDEAKKRDIDMVFHGFSDEPQTIAKINRAGYTVKPRLEQITVPDVMNRYKHFVWFLDRYGSYGRTLVEAMLCGMNVISNTDNFGLYSYPWNFKDPKNIRANLDLEYKQFWNKAIIY